MLTLIQQDLLPAHVNLRLRIYVVVLVVAVQRGQRRNVLSKIVSSLGLEVHSSGQTHLKVAQHDLRLAVSLLDRAMAGVGASVELD